MNPGPVADTLRNQIYIDNIIQNPKSAEHCFALQKATKAFFAEASLNAAYTEALTSDPATVILNFGEGSVPRAKNFRLSERLRFSEDDR